MISIDKNKVDALITVYDKVFDKHAASINTSLQNLLNNTTNPTHLTYLQALIGKGKKLITANLSELATFKADLDAIFIFNYTGSKAVVKETKDFKDEIIKALGYTKRRADLYPEYFQKLGIKACVYCNSQLCITAEDQSKKLVAKFQVDHYMPKDTYPCFCVTLYNLYPVCASCNNKKGVKTIQFLLYQEAHNIQRSSFSFEIIDKDNTVTDYLTNRNASKIKLKFNEPAVTGAHRSFDELFAVKGIYDTQIDLVEELILKYHIYNDVYREFLLDDFKGLFRKHNISLNQLIVGNYVEEEEMHKRPMSKFMQDIAVQIGLI